MKWIDLVRHLESHRCELLRDGSKHTLYFFPSNEQTSAVPWHGDVLTNRIANPSSEPGLPIDAAFEDIKERLNARRTQG